MAKKIRPAFFIVSSDLADKYGVEESIFLTNMIYWIKHNKADNINFHEGRTWTYNSFEAYSKFFTYWTLNQIRRIIKSLKDQNAIVTGEYNKMAGDRTAWYALADESMIYYDDIKLEPKSQKCQSISENSQKAIPPAVQTHIPSSANTQMVEGDPSVQNHSPIPEYYSSKVKQQNTPYIPQGDYIDDIFKEFANNAHNEGRITGVIKPEDLDRVSDEWNKSKPQDNQKQQLFDAVKEKINAHFKRRPTTPWTVKEIARLKELIKRPDIISECDSILYLYRNYEYQRKTVQTLLNNWSGELDIANQRIHQMERQSTKASL